MTDEIVNVRMPRAQASFLQANLSLLASNTRQAMTRPGIESGRRKALGDRAVLLERIEDAVFGAMLDGPEKSRKTNPKIELVTHPRDHDYRRLTAA